MSIAQRIACIYLRLHAGLRQVVWHKKYPERNRLHRDETSTHIKPSLRATGTDIKVSDKDTKSKSVKKARCITDQRTLSRLRLDKSDMGYAGCELIAVYNALILSGMPTSIESIIEAAVKSHMTVRRGRWGTNPYLIDRLAASYGIDAIRLKDSTELSSGIYIISLWNSGSIFSGIHTVCISIDDKNVTTYNMHYLDRPEKLTIGELKCYLATRPVVIAYYLSARQR